MGRDKNIIELICPEVTQFGPKIEASRVEMGGGEQVVGSSFLKTHALLNL